LPAFIINHHPYYAVNNAPFDMQLQHYQQQQVTTCQVVAAAATTTTTTSTAVNHRNASEWEQNCVYRLV
jgi:hypothetical protein